MILITGAAGKTGRAIISALVKKNQACRAFIRRQAQIEGLQTLGAAEVIVGDLQDPAAVTAACKDVRAVYHICPNVHPQEIEIGQNIIAAAKAASVQLFAYHSVLHPQIEDMPHHWNKMRVEELIFKSGLPYIILQPTAYMENILSNLETIKATGHYPVPYPIDTELCLIALTDLAEAAATLLTAPGHEYSTIELVGSTSRTPVYIAERLTHILGQPIEAVQINLNDWEQQARQAGLGEYQIQTLLKMFAYYDQYKLLGNSNMLTSLLGHSPTTLSQFLSDNI